MNAIKQSLNWKCFCDCLLVAFKNFNRVSLSKAELSLIHCLTVYWSYFLKEKKNARVSVKDRMDLWLLFLTFTLSLIINC